MDAGSKDLRLARRERAGYPFCKGIENSLYSDAGIKVFFILERILF
jgi:hypothetical protein